MDKPRVKPLAWERMKGIQTDFKAKSICGVYVVECFDDGDGDYYVWALEWGKIEGDKMQSAEAAKAAAQADYEARILAALEPVTVQEMPEVLTSEQLADACLWHRHDYGIVSKGEQEARRRNASDWWRAFQRALAERGE